jgi:pre-rRNA-processing protein IPI1
MARTLQALAEFVHAGIGQQSANAVKTGDATLHSDFPMWYSVQHQVPQKSNAFGYLNLFGMPKYEAEMLEDCEDRRRVFDKTFRASVEMGLEAARREGGDVGRAAAVLTKALG